MEQQREQLMQDYINLPVAETTAAGYRPERNGADGIELHERKQYSNNERATVTITATNLLGWHRNLSKQAKEWIALAACSAVSYDLGFKKEVGKKSLEKWLQQIDNVVSHGNARSVIRIKHKGRTGTGYPDIYPNASNPA